MSLPEGFCDSATYFGSAVQFLREYRWLYYYPNTDIISSNVLDCMPKEWCVYFEKNTEQFVENARRCIGSPAAPDSLNDFLRTVKLLTPVYTTTHFPNLQLEMVKGLGFKKHHEISLLAPLILNTCEENNIDYVVDVGCGLGYLTNLLKSNGMKIIGIDGNLKFVQTAREKYPDIYFEQLYVTTDSAVNIVGFLNSHFREFNENVHNVCLVALHACADLTVDMLSLSVAMDCFKMAVVMPCCYHRMKHKIRIDGDAESSFVNFPLSNEMKKVVHTTATENEDVFLNGTFLRLACQRADWKKQTKESRDIQTNNLMFRNILQFVVVKGGFRNIIRLINTLD